MKGPRFVAWLFLYSGLLVRAVWPVWFAADVQVAQVTQRGFIFFTHAARKVRVVQVLIARGLRHIFQDAQAIFNGPSAVRRHLLPLGVHVVADVVPLLFGQRVPNTDAIL